MKCRRVAAAYAMAGFATDATHVSSSGTALALTGIANAFANAANLVGLSTGAALATTPVGNGAVPQTEINTLGNVLAACVNSTGALSSACSTLLTNALAGGTTGTQPGDTAAAAINMAHNPAANIASLYALAASPPPFAPALTSAPGDRTVAIAITGGGLASPSGIAIDGSGNAWIANQLNGSNSVTEVSSSGAFLSGTAGYTGGGLHSPFRLAIDPSGSAWIVGTTNNVVEISSAGSILSGSSGYSGLNIFNGTSIVGASGIAIDGSGNVWIPNSSGNIGVTEFTNTGTFVGWINGTSFGMNFSRGVAVDSSATAWILNDLGNSISTFSTASSGGVGGTFQPGGGLSGPVQVAIDASGNAWTTNSSSLSKISNSGTALSGSGGITGGGLGSPFCLAIDGAGHVWVESGANQTLVVFSNSGAVLSGANGYRGGDLIYIPWIAIDGSGNVWATTTGNYVEEIIGAGTPVVTPLSVGAQNNTLGTRP
jgi:hypothetical protein